LFYSAESRPSEGVIAYRRRASLGAGQGDQIVIVVINFGDIDRTISIPAPAAGIYREMVDRQTAHPVADLAAAKAGDALTIHVPSNYGRIVVTP
jgi:hypothetical protein